MPLKCGFTLSSLVLMSLVALPPQLVCAEMPGMHKEMSGMQMDAEFGGISESRDASGTSWQPDETPMHAHHFSTNGWDGMVHYNAFLAYDNQSGPRGDTQFTSVNWAMLMLSKTSDMDQLTLRTMLSLEPWTATSRGYPLLFQSGESYKGEPLVDRQHPHDFFMEVAARYRRVLQPRTVFSLYVAPSGEPALGPTAFPHRMSAMDNPAAPITHHWIDSTHIAFGAVTLGLAQRQWQIEGSWFNGREPDEHRWNFDPIRLNSYSARMSWNPTEQWSAQISGGYLKSPEALLPSENVHRYTASVTHGRKLGNHSHLAATAGWGVNVGGATTSHAVFAEASMGGDVWNVYGRAEYVQKTGDELNLSPEHAKWDVSQVSLGLSRELVRDKPYQIALGSSLSYSFAPTELRRIYGDHPRGLWIFLRVRPAAMAMKH